MLSIIMTLLLFAALHLLAWGKLIEMGPKISAYGWKGQLLGIIIVCSLGGVSYLNLIAATSASFEVIFTTLNNNYSVMEFWELFIENFKELL